MICEYKVIFRAVEGVNGHAKPVGPLQELIVRAESGKPEKARLQVEQLDGVRVEGVTEWAPVLDWNQQTFDREEAAIYLRKSPATVDRLVAQGVLPKAQNGYPVFTRRMLDAAISHLMKGGKAE